MEFEHYGINVPDAAAMAQWYVEHCGMRVLRALAEPPHTHFLADATGRPVMEIYTNLDAPVPNFAEVPPLCFHCAFEADDPAADKKRLLAAGAKLLQDQVLEDGSHIVALRDPWGVPLQLCRRATRLTD